jgi:hypothetical protein
MDILQYGLPNGIQVLPDKPTPSSCAPAVPDLDFAHNEPVAALLIVIGIRIQRVKSNRASSFVVFNLVLLLIPR